MTAASLSLSIAKFLVWCKPRFKPATCELYRHYLERFQAFLGHDDLVKVDRLAVESFSVKKHPLEVVRRFLSWCMDVAGFVSRNATKGVVIPKSGRRTRVLSRLECVRIRRAAPHRLREMLLVLEETAARPHEGRGLRWNQLQGIDAAALTAGLPAAAPVLFLLEDFKGRSRRTNPFARRVLPVSPRLLRLLRRIAKRKAGPLGFVLRGERGKVWSANALRCSFRRVRERLAVVASVDVVGLVPYLYRHTLATSLAREGVSAPLLAEFLGHSSLDLLAWYVHPDEQDLCDLVNRKRTRRPSR